MHKLKRKTVAAFSFYSFILLLVSFDIWVYQYDHVTAIAVGMILLTATGLGMYNVFKNHLSNL